MSQVPGTLGFFTYTITYKLATPRRYHDLAVGHLLPFFNITTPSFAPKNGWGTLYMPQDGHWPANFEVIPPQKLFFPRPKKNKLISY